MTSSTKTTAILAGGKATRFGGQDKGAIIINGQRLIDIIHERIKPQSADIIISGTHDYGLGTDVIPDALNAPDGPVGGLYSIWKHLAARDLEGFFTVAVDGPNLPYDLLETLYDADASTIAADKAGQHPTYGWWRMVDLSQVWKNIELTESIPLKRIADLAGAQDRTWLGQENFININRQDDLDRFVKDA